MNLLHESALAAGMITEDMIREELARMPERSRFRAGNERLLTMMKIARNNADLRAGIEIDAFARYLAEEMERIDADQF